MRPEGLVLWVLCTKAFLSGASASAAAVAVDVGHYLKEPGAISARGVPEFEYNLRLARELAAALRAAGHTTMMIGDDGMAEVLGARAPRASGMDLFISIHHDSVKPRYLSVWEHEGALRSYSDRFTGHSIFVSRLNPRPAESLRCASAIGAEMRGAGYMPTPHHADPILGENRPFADEANGVHYFDNLAVLRSASIPALLFEAGIIVNRDEELRMRDPGVRRRIVAAIVSGISRCTAPAQQRTGEK